MILSLQSLSQALLQLRADMVSTAEENVQVKNVLQFWRLKADFKGNFIPRIDVNKLIDLLIPSNKLFFYLLCHYIFCPTNIVLFFYPHIFLFVSFPSVLIRDQWTRPSRRCFDVRPAFKLWISKLYLKEKKHKTELLNTLYTNHIFHFLNMFRLTLEKLNSRPMYNT